MKEDDTMGTIPRAVAERILREGGALRVSAEAKERFAIALEEYGHRFAAETVKIASHSGRKTIREADVDMAVDLLS
jgi:DNA-binding protein